MSERPNLSQEAAERPEVVQKWYFYNLKQSIDDPHKPFSAAALDSVSGTFDDALLSDTATAGSGKDSSPEPVAPFCDPETPMYSQATLRKTISPITEWIPFNPSDNKRLRAATADGDPVAVGHDRLLFQVHHLSSLRPIYWSIPYATRVAGVRWVFSDTQTPIDPSWDDEIFPHYMNFLNNVETYKETLEKAVDSEPAMIKVVTQRVDLKQAGKTLKVDLLFSPANSRVYMFKADSSYICTRNTASSLLSGAIPRGIIAMLKPFDFAEYKSTHALPDRSSDDPDYEPLPINNLILVFHGVGQKLSSSYTRINFVYAIDKLRVEIQEASESPEVYKHFPNGDPNAVRSLVLAVNWRSAFNASENFNVDAITVQSLLPVRQAFSDALLDIPLYMSENRRPQMLAAAASEANRLHALVRKHHPSFDGNGKTHLVGHSLGSLITADLLTNQPTVLNNETMDQAPFKFQTHNYFTTGSMLGVFMVLKGKHLRPREEFDEECKKEGRVPIKPEDRPFGCFAVDNMYNLVHQSDLLSFLVNATVMGAQGPTAQSLVGASGYSLEADELPSHEQSATPAISNTPHPSPPGSPSAADNIERDSPELVRNSSMSSLSRFFTAQLSRFSKEEPKVETTNITTCLEADNIPDNVSDLLKRFKKLNENGQIDWTIPQPVSYIPSHYLKMFTAHFDYWSNKEIARFLAIECGREPGEANTLPEHRVKWSFKINPEDIPETA